MRTFIVSLSSKIIDIDVAAQAALRDEVASLCRGRIVRIEGSPVRLEIQLDAPVEEAAAIAAIAFVSGVLGRGEEVGWKIEGVLEVRSRWWWMRKYRAWDASREYRAWVARWFDQESSVEPEPRDDKMSSFEELERARSKDDDAFLQPGVEPERPRK